MKRLSELPVDAAILAGAAASPVNADWRGPGYGQPRHLRWRLSRGLHAVKLSVMAASQVTARSVTLAVGALIMVVAGCAERPALPPAAAHVQPPDWFHQQLATARAAKRAYRPKDDTAGAQMAYDDVMRTACTRATLAGHGKYPARCDAVLRPTPAQLAADPCDKGGENSAMQTECSD